MKIYNEVIVQWDEKTQQYITTYEDSYDYDGELDLVAVVDENTIEGSCSTNWDCLEPICEGGSSGFCWYCSTDTSTCNYWVFEIYGYDYNAWSN